VVISSVRPDPSTSAVSTIVVFAMSVRGPAASRTKPARGGPRKAPAPLMQVSTPKAEVRRESSSISTNMEDVTAGQAEREMPNMTQTIVYDQKS